MPVKALVSQHGQKGEEEFSIFRVKSLKPSLCCLSSTQSIEGKQGLQSHHDTSSDMVLCDYTFLPSLAAPGSQKQKRDLRVHLLLIPSCVLNFSVKDNYTLPAFPAAAFLHSPKLEALTLPLQVPNKEVYQEVSNVSMKKGKSTNSPKSCLCKQPEQVLIRFIERVLENPSLFSTYNYFSARCFTFSLVDTVSKCVQSLTVTCMQYV